MIFGGVKKEHLQFNESTLWTGRPRSYQREDAWQYLDSIRGLLFAGKQAFAEELAEQHFMGKRDGDDDEYLEQKAVWFKKMRQDTSLCRVDVDDKDWKEINVPMPNGWEPEGLQGLDGAVWLRAHFDMPDKWDGKKEVFLDLGRVRDIGFVYVNGALAGVVDSRSRSEGSFEIASLLKRRGNVIAIQVINFNDKGGLVGGKDPNRAELSINGHLIWTFAVLERWKYKIQDEDPPVVPAYQAEYQPFGDLYVEFPGMDSGVRYRRQLDIGDAVATTSYDLRGSDGQGNGRDQGIVHYTREYFASAVDHALVMRVGADRPGRVGLRALLKTVQRNFSTRRIDESTLALYVKVRGGVLKGVSYLRVRAKRGRVQVSDSAVDVKGADEVEFYLTAATNFVDYQHADGDPEAICRDRMKMLAGGSYTAMRADHVREYRKYYDAFAIRLGKGSSLPTDERIIQHSSAKDAGLLALYVQYGRYLLISSSGPGAYQPANLQGIWNDLLSPPWGSKYTTNINLEMNYWPSEVLNLSACAEPLFRKIKDVASAGAATAKDYYKSPGWVLHHNTDLWCGTAPINAANHGIWQTGGAWLCHQLWEHFLFTRDTAFLRAYYPVMRGAAEFFVHTLVRDPVSGMLISAPSNSPEEGGLVAGPTMDHQIIRDLFKNCIAAAEVLGGDGALRDSLKGMTGQIAGNKIGQYGQLQEWMEDKDDTANKHRHISHLWGVFPGTEITWKDEAMMKAARQSLIYRGDAATGWSLAWKVNCWARFKDGDHTLRVADMLLTPVTGARGGGVYPNLFDAHPPFQIDGNFGGAAGVGEMLVQSQNGVVELLPALPHALPEGEVRGICARGGYVLNLRWAGGVLRDVDVFSKKGGVCVLQYGKRTVRLDTKAGRRYHLSGLQAFSEDLTLSNLRCEYKVDPLGVESLSPKLSWEIESGGRGVLQTAYRVLVSEDSMSLEKNAGTVWDSRKVFSDASIQVAYRGGALAPAKIYYWKVMVWSNHGDSSGWSGIARWQTGLFARADWKGARWIGYEEIPDARKMLPGCGVEKEPLRDTLPLLRKEFMVKGLLRKATVFICGLGHFELRLNGRPVGDHFLDPGWTRYDKEALYVPLDITGLLRQGGNAVGVALGNGFYYIPGERYHKLTVAYGYPKMIARIFLEYADGSTEDVVSDESWKVTAGPTLFSSEYGGEDYDARREQEGWDGPGFDGRNWKAAVAVDGPPELHTQQEEPVKRMQGFKPRRKVRLSAGTWVFDLGQNASGVPEIVVEGTSGKTVRVIPGELLHGDSVDQGATGEPCYFDYTLKGGGAEKWAPKFMYYGFRYLQVEGAVPMGEPNPDGLPVIVGVTGWHTRSALERDGKFSCSNMLFRRTDTLIDWAMKSNMVSVFTDCPHREKLGWLEQVHLMGSAFRYNYNIVNTYRKAIRDMMGAQTSDGLMPEIAPEFTQFSEPFRDSPEWGSSCIIVPWYCYQFYGDKQTLEESYPMMRRYNTYLVSKAQDHILYQGLGDWYDLGPGDPGVSQLTPAGLTATAIWYYDLSILSKTARLMGKTEDAAGYEELAAAVRKAFNKKFFNKTTHQYATGSQTANAMAVFAGLVAPADKAAVVENIVKDLRSRNNALTSGDIGFRYLLKVLADEGRSDVIFDMNSRTDVPGYGYQLAHGATALTESWQALPSVSNNHFMLGHIMEWFYTGLAGIRAAEEAVGFRDIVLRPEMTGDVTWADGEYHSPYGMITSHWKKEGKGFAWSISIPVNSRAVVYLPVSGGAVITEGRRLLRDRKDVVLLRREGGKMVLQVGSGNYEFLVR